MHPAPRNINEEGLDMLLTPERIEEIQKALCLACEVELCNKEPPYCTENERQTSRLIQIISKWE